jgi:hypothetical protein
MVKFMTALNKPTCVYFYIIIIMDAMLVPACLITTTYLSYHALFRTLS